MHHPDETLRRPPANLLPRHGMLFDWPQSVALACEVGWGTYAPPAWSASLAQSRLESLVDLARARSPFHAARCRHLPADGWTLRDLPVLTRTDLMQSFDDALTVRDIERREVDAFCADAGRVGESFRDQYAVWTSSGTTGMPGVFIHDEHALAVYDALEALRFRGPYFPAPLTLATFATERYAIVCATGGHFASNVTAERLRRENPLLASQLRVFSILDPIDRLVAALDAFQPTVLASYPTALAVLAEEQSAGRLSIRPHEVWAGGENFTSRQRDLATQAFGGRVRQGYGASEFLPIAWECARGNLHVNADWVILEPVDAQFAPVAPGIASHTVLLTNLANHVQPLIRYDLGDSVTLHDTGCACGCTLPVITVHGRCDDTLAFRGAGKRVVHLLPLAISTVLEDDAGLFDFQLVQIDGAHLLLRAGRSETARAAPAAEVLRAWLHSQGLGRIDVALDTHPPQPDVPSGKMRRVIAAK